MAAVCCPVKSSLQDLLTVNRNFAQNTYDSRASPISQVLCVSHSILSQHNQLQQRRTMNLDAESSGSSIAGSGNSGNMEMYVSESDKQLTVVKAHERMTKKRVTVSIWEWHQSWCCREYIY